MKRFLVLTLATATVGFLAAGAAFAADDVSTNFGTFDLAPDSGVTVYTAGMAANGIASTRHNVGGTGNYIAVRSDVNAAGLGTIGANGFSSNDPKLKGGEGGGSTEICVFCHTPHHSVKAQTGNKGEYAGNFGNAPLWNRKGMATGYTAYGTTIGGSVITTVGGVSLACLSCHDGVTAMDNLVNGPGVNAMSDRWNGTYGDANSQGFAFADVFDTSINAYQIGQEERINIGNGGTGYAGNGTTVADLSNDHPMSVVYSDGSGIDGADTIKRASLRDRTTQIATIDLASGLYFTTSTAYGTEIKANLSQNRWADKGFISETAEIADMLREGKVECSSCHDPHFKNLSNVDLVDNTVAGERYGDDPAASGQIANAVAGGTTVTNIVRRRTSFAKQDGLFLRRVGGNAGSGVCRTCHNK
ncbi:MAG: hypothetical protein HZB85_08840 [Deltaproteobacteria bacterium]|nr:hypothetical protein [Deltaproteobacteria bacterium]